MAVPYGYGRNSGGWPDCWMELMALNSDTGEHITNEKNELEYIPFPTCEETGKPLELQYGIEDGRPSSVPRRCSSTDLYYRAQLHNSHDYGPFLPPSRILCP